MTSLRTALAQNMKAGRQILGISQAQLAERVNTSANYIAQIETEKRFPTPEMLERIATALEIEPTALFTAEILKSQNSDRKALFYPANCHRTKGSRRPDNRDFCVIGGAKIHKRDRLPASLADGNATAPSAFLSRGLKN
jgi:transcriptional regulator with XRE-family HTH domain